MSAPEQARAAVKTAWKLLVEALGGVEATSAACGIARSLVSEYGNRNGDRYPPAHTIIAAEKVAGEPLVTAVLARAQGYELMPLGGRPPHELAACLKEVSMDSGKLLADVVDLMSQAKHERSRRAVEAVLRDLGELARASLEALIALKAEEGGE